MFRLLGPVRLELDQGDVDLGPGKQRGLLAALLLTPGQPVPSGVLVDRLWGDRPPQQARNVLATYVTRLRRSLGAASSGGREPITRLQYMSGGYRIECEPELVDLHRARRLVREARSARQAGDPRRAVGLLVAALSEWQPVALAGVPGEWAARVRDGLRAERLDLIGYQAETALELGRHAEVAEELRALVAEHPGAEVLVAPLLIALAGAGRSAEALDCYAQARQAIAEQLGSEPSPRLQDLHLRILRNDPLLTRPHAAPPALGSGAVAAVPASRAVPSQLPADVSGFTGREAELAELDGLLTGPEPAPGDAPGAEEPTAVVISAVSGTAGVGKTALAVRWAHQARERFPDGQLYVNLRGYDPDRPVNATDALAGFLAALGVAGENLPVELHARAALYRTQLAGRRMLIVIDNASSVDQVRPLLPGTHSCAVIVTSRDSLAGLVARDGARRLDLDLLPPPDALALLRRLIGDRADAEPDAVAALSQQCVRLPLALRVAAELVVSRPAMKLGDLVAEIRDERRRLDLLDAAGDSRAAVTAVFSWSLRHLPPAAARTFRLLGLHPGPDVDEFAAAALADVPPQQARRSLDLLARAHLVHVVRTRVPDGPNPTRIRFGMHDLLRAYAASLATAHRDEDDPDAARRRLFDYYVAAATGAVERLFPGEAHRRPRLDVVATVTPHFGDADVVRAWLDGERPTLRSVVAYTAAHGWPAHALQLAAVLFRHLAGGHHADALAIHGYALDAARQVGDRAGEARSLLGIGAVHSRLGGHAAAAEHYRLARDAARDVGDSVAEGRALSNLGAVRFRLGDYRAAAEHYEQAIDAYRRVGDQLGEGHALMNLSAVESRVGRFEAAIERCEGALARFESIKIGHAAAASLLVLGHAEAQLARYDRAIEHIEQGLALYREVGNRSGHAWGLITLADLCLRLDRPDEATAHYRTGLAVFAGLGERAGESWALNGLGELAAAAGRPREAVAHHAAALETATEAGLRDVQARAHAGLGCAYRALGDRDRARDHYERALTMFDELGVPDAAAVRASLTDL